MFGLLGSAASASARAGHRMTLPMSWLSVGRVVKMSTTPPTVPSSVSICQSTR